MIEKNLLQLHLMTPQKEENKTEEQNLLEKVDLLNASKLFVLPTKTDQST